MKEYFIVFYSCFDRNGYIAKYEAIPLNHQFSLTNSLNESYKFEAYAIAEEFIKNQTKGFFQIQKIYLHP